MAVKRYLSKAATGPVCRLDSWQTVIQMPEGEIEELPYALKKVDPADRLEISQFLTMISPEFICLT